MARYCPDGDFRKICEGPGISYTWRSIVRGLKALDNGLIWRIGDGTQVRIWEDPWIRYGFTRRPRTPRRGVLLSKVAELNDPNTGTWDTQLVRDIFWEEDATNILSIPTIFDRDDYIAWHFHKKGVFTVKSAYHVLEDRDQRLRRRQQGEGSSSNNSGETTARHWKNIWNFQCPPRIK
jgi:hypothetical protein